LPLVFFPVFFGVHATSKLRQATLNNKWFVFMLFLYSVSFLASNGWSVVM